MSLKLTHLSHDLVSLQTPIEEWPPEHFSFRCIFGENQVIIIIINFIYSLLSRGWLCSRVCTHYIVIYQTI